MKKSAYKKIEEKLISLVAKNKYVYKLTRFIGFYIYTIFIYPKYFIFKDINNNEKLLTIKKTGESFYVRKKNFRQDAWVFLENFINEEYVTDFYPVLNNIKGKIVLDIGAFVGDTAVFFGKKGASVYAYEPSKELYEIAKKNIKLNNIDAKIFNLGIGDKNTNAKITHNKNNIVDSSSFVLFEDQKTLEKFKKDRLLFTEEVKIIFLNEVLEQFETIYLLKMDCEGCEFSSISSVKDENLQKIKYIIIEVHFMNVFDSNIIISKLNANNFEVNIKCINGINGMLYAKNLS